MAAPLNQISGMPQMSAAFAGWTIPITLSRITQAVVDGFVTESSTSLTIQGTWQPLKPQEIALKPEGQRSWSWFDLHCEGSALHFDTNDRIVRDGIRYKIMAVKDYTLNNYSEYHLVLDYQDE
jgi:hypothetical protein